MHIKRYLLLCAAATVLLVLAIFGLFQAPGPSWLQSAFTFIRQSLGRFLPPGAVTIVSAILCIVLLVISLLLLVLGLVLLARSVLTATTGGLRVEEIGRIIYRYRKADSLPRIVVVGGGTGIKPVIESLRTENVKLTTIVTMADSGGSTGRLRDAMGILPPGDFRNALIATAGDSTRKARLLGYRFPDEIEGLGGHNMGNLMIAALTDIKGNFGDAVGELSELMQLPGRVLPMSLDNISLRAHFTDGSTIDGESQVPLQGKTIDSIEILPPHAKPFVPALQALTEADFIVIGPGSLFTSLLPPLSIEVTADTIARSSATKVLVINAMTEKGETDHYTAQMHLHKIEEVLGGPYIDMVLLSNTPIPSETLARYAAAGVEQVRNDLPRKRHPMVVEADICSTADGFVRHDPTKLRTVLESLLGL
ncbi:MAG: uridine diphosphate-N-acetylglucosamine-binding protein YvcK [Candidatus Cryosericum sp.]|nr:uridine diphosphate-N-acetylglucosamine-binding protein YvcK [bacterium]